MLAPSEPSTLKAMDTMYRVCLAVHEWLMMTGLTDIWQPCDYSAFAQSSAFLSPLLERQSCE